MSVSPKELEEAKVQTTAEAVFPDYKSGEVTRVIHGNTHRGLSSRHIQFLALGGCIGTGLFVGSGSTLSTVGPGESMLSLMGDSGDIMLTVHQPRCLWAILQCLL